MIALTTTVAISEGFVVGMKAGLSPDELYGVLRGGAVGQNMFLNFGIPRALQGRFDDGEFKLSLAHKDLALAVDLARECRASSALALMAEQQLLEGIARGWGDRDATTAFLLLKRRAGFNDRDGDP
jgi:3-hydroxyisobutyrate dehydrogenase-like beta-hydroxyacid dehydrogenase